MINVCYVYFVIVRFQMGPFMDCKNGEIEVCIPNFNTLLVLLQIHVLLPCLVSN